jgi:hypothetical protein
MRGKKLRVDELSAEVGIQPWQPWQCRQCHSWADPVGIQGGLKPGNSTNYLPALARRSVCADVLLLTRDRLKERQKYPSL